jgi:hypothetical protein
LTKDSQLNIHLKHMSKEEYVTHQLW